MTSSGAAYKLKSRSINWVSASLLTAWVLLVSMAAESLGESNDSAEQRDEQGVVQMSMEHRVDLAICRVYSQAKNLLGS